MDIVRRKRKYRVGQLVGQHGFSYVTDIKTSQGKPRKAIFICRCGKKFNSEVYKISSGRTTHCGCIKKKPRTKAEVTIDLYNNLLKRKI